LIQRTLILASSSRYRVELLHRLGVAFTCWPPEIDERPAPNELPRGTAVRLARAKAEAAAARHPEAWIIGCDQVADHAGHPVGKPGTVEAARAQLRSMRGERVVFHTALCVLPPGGSPTREELIDTEVVFRALTDAEIERYLEREPALDCAGSAKSEGLGIALLERLRGDDPTALIGLPLIALAKILRAEGFELP
jgi:septum formation protein